MTAVLLILVGGLPVLTTLLTYTLFCYEEANRTGQPLAIFLKLACRAAFRSTLSETLIFVLHPVGLWPGLWRRPRPGTSPLVILVHGLFHNPSAWILFRRWFHARGVATSCVGYPSWGGRDLEQVIADVRDHVDRLRRENPGRDIHLVGHSLGGLVLRAAVADLAPNPSIKSLTTLGTPFLGSKLAPFALHSLGRFIWHDSPSVREVAARPFPTNIQGQALWSRADNMVLPNSALWCEVPGWKNQETASISHIAMLHSREVFEDVMKVMRAASADGRGRAD